MEPEVLRCYTRAARAAANQPVPLSACSVLKDQEIYNMLSPAQMDITSTSDNNGKGLWPSTVSRGRIVGGRASLNGRA